MLREDRHGRGMTRQTTLSLLHRRIGLHPYPQHRPEHRRFERGTMQQGGIDPPERFQVRSLLAHALPFFVMTIVALLAIFRPDENLFDLRHPISRYLAIGLLRDRPFMKGDVEQCHEQQHPPPSPTFESIVPCRSRCAHDRFGFSPACTRQNENSRPSRPDRPDLPAHRSRR